MPDNTRQGQTARQADKQSWQGRAKGRKRYNCCKTIDERALANVSKSMSGVESLMIGHATRATIGVKLAFLEAASGSSLQLEAIRELCLRPAQLKVLPVLRAKHLSVQTSVKRAAPNPQPNPNPAKKPFGGGSSSNNRQNDKQQHVLCHTGSANKDNCELQSGSSFGALSEPLLLQPHSQNQAGLGQNLTNCHQL